MELVSSLARSIPSSPAGKQLILNGCRKLSFLFSFRPTHR
jgi:hypothetical protein